jgi:hypothetical protein
LVVVPLERPLAHDVIVCGRVFAAQFVTLNVLDPIVTLDVPVVWKYWDCV